MTRIKICGITNKTDAVAAAGLGVDMLGFVFYKKSKRYVEPEAAEDIINELPPSIKKVGVFVDEDKDDVLKIAQDALLDTLQFHGDETPGYCESFKGNYGVIKAFRLKDRKDLEKTIDYNADYYLFDTYSRDSIGGTGETFDWDILRDYEILRPVILSGGLSSKNVANAIREISPYGVDCSTGVEESPGKKSLELMKGFIENVRKADR